MVPFGGGQPEDGTTVPQLAQEDEGRKRQRLRWEAADDEDDHACNGLRREDIDVIMSLCDPGDVVHIHEQRTQTRGLVNRRKHGRGPLTSAEIESKKKVQDKCRDYFKAKRLQQLPQSKLNVDECAGCLRRFPTEDTVQGRCVHVYCFNCLAGMVRAAIRADPFHQVKCCGVIIYEDTLRKARVTEYERTVYRTKLSQHRMLKRDYYCFDCGAPVAFRKDYSRVVTCSECGKNTCKTCRGKSHCGFCDEATIERAQMPEHISYLLAEKKYWKECPNCSNLVQKNGGLKDMV
ncbi:hypothetical protein SLS62_005945 [Diatrype stigma]|uniref:RING-type domain-containing protein n=1 Tax=Diatrype stigma TaxID=117547 RepID=A0AAN9YN27_9PEZI